MKRKINLLVIVLMMFGLSACSMSMPKFDQAAYEESVSLKVDSLTLAQKAVEAYEKHEEAVNSLKVRLEKSYEYAKGKPNNEISTKQWKIIQDPKGHQIGGYLERWKEKKTLSKGFVENAIGQFKEGFDYIIGLESGLIKAKNK